MMAAPLRIGLIGAGDNTRKKHIPGLRALESVELVAVCNRRRSSSEAVANEYGIPKVHEHWEDVVSDRTIDAVVIGTWPYLHAPITIAALEAGKHVLCEARMSMNAAEARTMLEASRKHSNRIAQLVPSPFGLHGDEVIRHKLESGYIGELREYQVVGLSGALADAKAPLSWRQDAALSGVNMLTLGILHETVLRWLPNPVRVMAQAHAFIPGRVDPQSGVRRPVGTPDSVQVLTVLPSGARGVYQFSGVTPLGGGMYSRLFGSDGVLHYDLSTDRIYGVNCKEAQASGELQELPIPPEQARGWQVEMDFVNSIRIGSPVKLTDFETGVAYMEFTEAVARSAQTGEAVEVGEEEAE
jgi:predicted dehydrogenase